MSEIIQRYLMYACLGLVGLAVTYWSVRALGRFLVWVFTLIGRKFVKLGVVRMIVVGIGVCWSVLVGGDKTNAPPDGASGPLSVPRLLSDSPADEPEGDAVDVTNLQFTAFSVTPTNLAAGLGWPLGLFATPTYLEIVAHYPELTNDGSLVESVPVPFGATNVSFTLDAAMLGFTNGLPPAIFLDAVERASLANSSADHDRDRVIDSDEVAAGTDPFDSDTDADGLSDGEELGSAQVLCGDDFLWFEPSDNWNYIRQDRGATWMSISLAEGVSIDGTRYSQIHTTWDGIVHLYPNDDYTGWEYAHGDQSLSGDLALESLSGGFVTVLAADANVYYRPTAWGSGVFVSTVVTNGTSYDVIECLNVGLESDSTSGTNSLLSYEIILPRDEPNVVYVSYARVDEGFRALGMNLGLQCQMLRNPVATNEFYHLHSPIAGSNLVAGTTIRYEIGTATDPTAPDTDGDGILDGYDPFPRDASSAYFGQCEEWVRANFELLRGYDHSVTSAEDVVSQGYTNWVDDVIGTGIANGYYEFIADFTDDPPVPTQLHVGEYSVCVTTAGKYVFLLKKGEEYEFGTRPHNGEVEYTMLDDVAAAEPRPMALADGMNASGEWTVDEGGRWIDYPSMYSWGYSPGRCCWMPTLRGSPEVGYLAPHDSPKLFSAIVYDYPNPDDLSYEWHSSDENVSILTPHSRETLIAVDCRTALDAFDLSVATDINGRHYTSSVRIGYGTNDTPLVSLRMSAPEVVFVNDDDRTSRWYRVSAEVVSPTPTNALLSLSHTGGAQVLFASDPRGCRRFALTNVNLTVDAPLSSAGYEFYFASTNNNCTGMFTATCTLPDASVVSASRGYKVIEPLRKLVCTNAVPYGGYYNPSRLVYGTNAWLKVGVNGDFAAADVRWSVVSGPGLIVARNDADWAVQVEPTASSGEVVVEAAFGNDSPIQPRFVLPVVQKRMIPAKAFVVTDNGVWAASAESISNKLAIANQVYSQVGVEFNLLSITTNNVGTANDMVVREYDYTTNSNGRVRKSFAQQAINLLNTYTSNDCVELYFVRTITNGMATAFRQKRGIIISARAVDETLAHELGHALGLQDCYVLRRLQSPDASGRRYCYLTNCMLTVSSSLLTNRTRDWGREEGRAFYEKSDIVRDVSRRFIMYGVGERGNARADIPNGRINCLTKEAVDSSQMQRARIGADDIEPSNERVYSK